MHCFWMGNFHLCFWRPGDFALFFLGVYDFSKGRFCEVEIPVEFDVPFFLRRTISSNFLEGGI